jgi:hypothetical protein
MRRRTGTFRDGVRSIRISHEIEWLAELDQAIHPQF